MAERVNHPLVTKYDEVRQNVQTFNEVLKGLESLQANLLRFKSWYYLPELDAVAPSKVYRVCRDDRGLLPGQSQGGSQRRANRPPGSADGSRRWNRDSKEYQHVFDKVQQLLADNGKAFKKKPHLRFNAPPGWKAPVGNLGITNRNLYIGGEWVDSTADSSYEVRNPAHRYHVLAEVQAAGVEDAERAVAAATDAASSWAATPAPQRGGYSVQGPRADAGPPGGVRPSNHPGRGEIAARRPCRGATLPEHHPVRRRRRTAYVRLHDPVGDAGHGGLHPSPPPGSSGRHHAVELSAGHPGMEDCAGAYLRQRRCFQASVLHPTKRHQAHGDLHRSGTAAGGIEPGHGGREGSVGSYLVNHPDIAGISFTGSTEIGTGLYAQAASTLKKVQCEMGGKNAVIVLADADMEQAVGSVAVAAFGSTGQRCTATSRVIVEETALDTFLEGLVERTKGLTIGDGLDSNDVGPVASEGQFQKIMEYIDIGKEEGANLLHGGSALTGPGFGGGLYVEPTIFTDVEPGMRIAKEEIFGAGAHGVLVSRPSPRH